ncbi:uncharacterized protein LOC143851999 [Tasmannia lanceolata]|uniref:uncharacterized protein LOC143851999 n=1 Tax=Tasmannia lanceolata TaxID=3420 RepID=UPI0040647054
MLSTENDPSCSPLKKADERATQKLALQEANLVKEKQQQQLLPNFSIRDYVYTARTKDIGANWPFPGQFLQLCLKHGVKDILPPFEPPDSIRARCCKNSVGSDQLIVYADGDKTLEKCNLFEDENGSVFDSELTDIKYKSCNSFDKLLLETSDQVRSPPLSEASNLTADEEVKKSCRSLGLTDADGEGKIVSTALTSHSQIEEAPATPTNSIPCLVVPEIDSFSEASIDLQAAEPPYRSDKIDVSCQTANKKCRLVVKLGVNSESSQTEELVSNSCSVLEPMASKVCPVCRTFSATSNTTLNAHIDQCLAVESTSKRAVIKLTDLKERPRKKRSMMDICATAPCCTLEELERRNGLSGAPDLSSSTPADEVQVERKRQWVPQVDFMDDGNEGAVYVDSNGTKLRILSKFNNSSAPTVEMDCRPSKYVKDREKGRSFSMNKKKCLASKCSKALKVKPHSKKICSLKLCKGEIRGAPDEEYHMKNQEKEESLSQLLKARDPIQTSGSRTLRQWVCSKRTGPSEKSNERGSRGVARDLVPMNRNPSIERNQSNLSSPTERHHIMKLLKSSESSTSSPRSKRLGSRSNTVNVTDNMEKKSSKPPESHFNKLAGGASTVANGCIQKSVRSSGNSFSPRSKRVKILASIGQTSLKLSEIHPFSLKTKRISTVRKNALLVNPYLSMKARKNNENEKLSAFKKSRKDRYIAKMHGWIGESASDMHEGCDRIRGSAEVLGPSSTSLTKMHGTHKSDRSKNIMRSKRVEIISEVSLGRSIMLEAGQDREVVSSSERKQAATLKGLDLAVDCHSPDPTDVDSQVGRCLQYLNSDIFPFNYDYQESDAGVPVGVDGGVNFSVEKAVEDHNTRSSETPTSEDNLPAYCSNMPSDPSQSLEGVEHTRPTFGIDVRVDPMTPRPSNDQEIHYTDEIGDDSTNLSCFRTAVEMDARVEGESILDVQHMQCRIDPMPNNQGPQVCASSFGDVGFEVLQDNSMVTSRTQFTPDMRIPVNGDLSGSHVSVTSGISLPPTAKSGFKCLENDSSFGSHAVHEKSSLSCLDSSAKPVYVTDIDPGCALAYTASMGRAKRVKLDREKLKATITPAKKEAAKISDDQPCCCLRKGSASLGAAVTHQESQSRESIMGSKMLSTKRKQNVNSGPEVSTFSTFSSSSMNEMVVPVLESPTGSISLKESLHALGKLSSYSDFDLASPSSQTHPQPTSNPILRLMGKNLMVLNNDEDEAVRLERVPICAPHDHANAKCLGFSPGSDLDKNRFSFYRQSPDGSMIFG